MAGERFALMKNHQCAGGGNEDREGGHDDSEEGFLHRRQRCLAARVPKSMAGDRFALDSEEVAPRSAAGPIRSKIPHTHHCTRAGLLRCSRRTAVFRMIGRVAVLLKMLRSRP